jgi:hypothetical protein
VGVLHDLLRRPQQSCRYVSRQRFLAHNQGNGLATDR